MVTTVEFAFSMQQEVKVKPIGMVGIIDSMSVDICGKQYRVVYWNDAQRCSQWLYEWEIEARG